jgi:CRP/FNR family cyclic AMP-dependent transcriptional regulator
VEFSFIDLIGKDLPGDRMKEYNDEILKLLREVELFDGLTDADLKMVAALCKVRKYRAGDLLTEQGKNGRELYIISDGLVEVIVHEPTSDRVILNLGTGQLIGEMSLVDQGPRSATVKAVHDPTIVQVIRYKDFESLCKQDTNIGYRVMQNLAADLSFKLRHSNLSEG